MFARSTALLGLSTVRPALGLRTLRAHPIQAVRLAHTLPEHTVFYAAGEGEDGAPLRSVPEGTAPIACLLSWVGGGKRALRKYSSLYTSRGIDVVALHTKPAHVYRPISKGRQTMAEIVDCLTSPDGGAGRPLLIHGFSAGGFMYGNLLCELGSRGEAGADFIRRIKGLAFDSPVDLNGVPFGLSRAITGKEGSLTQRTIQAIRPLKIAASWFLRFIRAAGLGESFLSHDSFRMCA